MGDEPSGHAAGLIVGALLFCGMSHCGVHFHMSIIVFTQLTTSLIIKGVSSC